MGFKISITQLITIIYIVLLIPVNLMAQKDSINIKTKILESEESDQILILKTRDFILNKLKSGEIQEARTAYNFIVNKYKNDQVRPFWIDEKFLLGFWFGNYNAIYNAESILNSSEYFVEGQWNLQHEYIYPQVDRLDLELQTISGIYKPEIIQRLDSLVLDKEKHDYLVLFFDWLTFNAPDLNLGIKGAKAYLEENLTPRAEVFLSKYKDSKFQSFVQKNFRYVYILNDWGVGIYLAGGILSPHGEANSYLKPEFTIGVGGNLGWKNIIMDVGFDMGIPVKIRKPFVYEGKTWTPEFRYNYYTYYFNAGFVLKETKSLKFSPRIGISGVQMNICEADKDKINDDLSMTQFAVQYGMNCDIKLSISDFMNENNFSYSGIRLGFDYFQFLGHNPIMTGGMLRFQVSWIGFTRSIIRSL